MDLLVTQKRQMSASIQKLGDDITTSLQLHLFNAKDAFNDKEEEKDARRHRHDEATKAKL